MGVDIPDKLREVPGRGGNMSDPIFTFHSALRLMERGITRDHILAAVGFGHVVESRDGKDTYALERMRVVVVRDSRVIVTAYRARKENAKRNIRKARAARKKNKRRWGRKYFAQFAPFPAGKYFLADK